MGWNHSETNAALLTDRQVNDSAKQIPIRSSLGMKSPQRPSQIRGNVLFTSGEVEIIPNRAPFPLECAPQRETAEPWKIIWALKLQCGCGQKVELEVYPEHAAKALFICPACGVDNSAVATRRCSSSMASLRPADGVCRRSQLKLLLHFPRRGNSDPVQQPFCASSACHCGRLSTSQCLGCTHLHQALWPCRIELLPGLPKATLLKMHGGVRICLFRILQSQSGSEPYRHSCIRASKHRRPGAFWP